MNTFKTSDRVVCVRDDFLPEDEFLFAPELPKRGQVYAVREFRVTHGIAGVLLVGITGRRCAEFGCEYGFKADRFRKIVEADVEAELTCALAF